MTAEAFWFHTPTVVTGFLIDDTRHTSGHASLVHFRLSLLRKSLLRKMPKRTKTARVPRPELRQCDSKERPRYEGQARIQRVLRIPQRGIHHG